MPKRSANEKIISYKRKIQKLEEKNRNRKRIIIYSDSSSDSEENPDIGTKTNNNNDINNDSILDDKTSDEHEFMVAQNDNHSMSGCVAADENKSDTLDPEFLSALGDTIVEEITYGEEILPELAQRWTPILRKGLEKETKNKLLKEYNIPSNCKLLRAPSLNPEVAAASSDIARARDKKIENNQQILGLGITAINRAISMLLKGDNKNCPILPPTVKILSDSVRILADLHFDETQKRSKMLMTGLDKTFINVIQDCERDETLFGMNLPEKIKASKAIERQSSQIKKPDPKSTGGPSSSRSNTRYQGNWRGPSRSMNRGGGRGGPRPMGRIMSNRKNIPPLPYTQSRTWPNRYQRAPNNHQI